MADKLLSLLDDEDRRYSMGRFGRMRVAHELSWDHEVPRLLAAYEAVFAPESSVAPAISPVVREGQPEVRAANGRRAA
jgi:hypothetical protein